MKIHCVVGRVGQDAKLEQVGASSVIKFSIAETETYKTQSGEKKETVTWYNCSIWNKPNLAKFIKKGDTVSVMGKISARAYLSNGEPKASLELNVRDFEFVHSGAKAETKVDLTPNFDDDFNF